MYLHTFRDITHFFTTPFPQRNACNEQMFIDRETDSAKYHLHKRSNGLKINYCSLEKKVKQSRYTPWRRLGGEEVYLLLIHDLGTRWG
jgi:hypothetical protein